MRKFGKFNKKQAEYTEQNESVKEGNSEQGSAPRKMEDEIDLRQKANTTSKQR
jgi:hypothetical protein